MFCKNCGAKFEYDDQFCQSCGQAKEAAEEIGQQSGEEGAVEVDTEVQPSEAQENPVNEAPPVNGQNTINVNIQNSQYPYNPYIPDPQANNYQQPQKKRLGSATGYAIFGFVVAAISIIILMFDYVLMSFWTFIAPIVSFISIPKDKRNGVTNFTLAIVFNIITIVVGIICMILYFIAVGQG